MTTRTVPAVEYSAATIAEYQEQVAAVRDRWIFRAEDAAGPWFRGHQRRSWELLPGLLRLNLPDRNTEDEIREEFILRAPALCGADLLPPDKWSSYFLMQHYGAPTRLLDWTESPLIALYFAVRDNLGYYDATVWMLDPYELNRRIIGVEEVIAPSAPGLRRIDETRVSKWLPERFNTRAVLPKDPIAVFPVHFARRISSQRSCFTIHGSRRDGFGRFYSPRGCVAKIIIPAHAVENMKSSLAINGIDETTIYPDLQGLARALISKWCLRELTGPHNGVYVRLRPSKIHKGGVGVFAIRKIPKGTNIFSGENEEVLWIQEDKIAKPGSLRKLYDDFSIIKDGRYGCPVSFNRLTPAWYLNSSGRPNAICNENYEFVAGRDIRPGEEITVDYSTFSEEPGASGKK